MTHKATLTQPGSATKRASSAHSLAEAIASHRRQELASFHTPGHKGRQPVADAAHLDVTELPGLDQLSNPRQVLCRLEKKAAHLFGAAHSFISVNGASAGLAAAIVTVAQTGRSKLIVPANVHRSVIHGLVLSGLEPIWIEPDWLQDWGTHAAVGAETVENALLAANGNAAAVVIVSPTYAGIRSDIAAISEICRKHNTYLIVDEAHGSHCIEGTWMPPSAVSHADIVVHSLHKTLSGLTQTALVHLSPTSTVEPGSIRSALNLLHTSSPSYLLMFSIEQTLDQLLSGPETINSMAKLRVDIEEALSQMSAVVLCPNTDPAHILIKVGNVASSILFDTLAELGVFAETVLGNGLLFLLGTGSNKEDVVYLLSSLARISGTTPTSSGKADAMSAPACLKQEISPRAAFMAQCEFVPANRAAGRIAADCVAPCPPGLALIVPGQRITRQAVDASGLDAYRVVIESSIRGEH